MRNRPTLKIPVFLRFRKLNIHPWLNRITSVLVVRSRRIGRTSLRRVRSRIIRSTISRDLPHSPRQRRRCRGRRRRGQRRVSHPSRLSSRTYCPPSLKNHQYIPFYIQTHFHAKLRPKSSPTATEISRTSRKPGNKPVVYNQQPV